MLIWQQWDGRLVISSVCVRLWQICHTGSTVCVSCRIKVHFWKFPGRQQQSFFIYLCFKVIEIVVDTSTEQRVFWCSLNKNYSPLFVMNKKQLHKSDHLVYSVEYVTSVKAVYDFVLIACKNTWCCHWSGWLQITFCLFDMLAALTCVITSRTYSN